MKTIGHHVCAKNGGLVYVEKEAPFISNYSEKKGEKNYPFLGTGYYFWDDNIEVAKWWGENFYKNDYFIVKGDLNLNDGTFLDLVGNRSHMKWLQSLIIKLRQYGFEREKWALGSLIEFAKKLSKQMADKDIFPYMVIRSIDYSAKGKSNYLINFAKDNTANYTYLEPRLIICLIEKNIVVLPTTKIIYASTQ